MTPELPAVLLILFLSGFVGAVLLELLLRRAVRIGSLTPPTDAHGDLDRRPATARLGVRI